MTVENIVRDFREFLINNGPFIQKIFKDEYLISDWLQANWEVIVESSISKKENTIFLEVYGDGAECNDNSSRVWKPEALPTHRIHCNPKTGNRCKDYLSNKLIYVENLIFDKFISWNGKIYSENPPFDFVLLNKENDIFIVSIDDVVFDLKKL